MAFKVGDRVQMGYNGPLMTVDGVITYGADKTPYYRCLWFDRNQVLHSHQFQEQILLPKENTSASDR